MRTRGDQFIFLSQPSGTGSDDCGSKIIIGPLPGRGACGQENMVQTSKTCAGPQKSGDVVMSTPKQPLVSLSSLFFEHYKHDLLSAVICVY